MLGSARTVLAPRLRRRRQPGARAAARPWLEALTQEPYDAAPKPWRSFFAVRLAAAVVESNTVRETVSVCPIEALGLDWPPSLQEARRRVRANAIVFRQNYAIVLGTCLAAGALRRPLFSLALLCAATAAAVSSDRLLGELALALDGQLAWNEKRVASLDRGTLRTGAGSVAALCLALQPSAGLAWLVCGLLTASVLALLHALTRPVDVESVVGSLWNELRGAKSSADVAASLSTAWASLPSVFGRKRAAVPIVVVETGAPRAGQPPGQHPGPQTGPQQRLGPGT